MGSDSETNISENIHYLPESFFTFFKNAWFMYLLFECSLSGFSIYYFTTGNFKKFEIFKSKMCSFRQIFLIANAK